MRTALHSGGYAGVRVGEASHPGPGGASATRRKQHAKVQQQQQQSGFGGFSLDTILQQLVNMLLPLLLAQLGPRGTSNGGAPSNVKDTKSDKHAKQPGKKAKAKKPQTPEPPVPPSGKQTSQPPVCQTKEAPETKPSSLSSSQQGEWVRVVRGGRKVKEDSNWTLRQADWSDSIVAFDDLSKKLDGTELRCVTLVPSLEDVDVVKALLQGSALTSYAVTLVCKDVTAERRVPGLLHGQLSLQKASLTEVVTKGMQAPGLKHKSPDTPKVSIQTSASQTVVVRFCVGQTVHER